MKPRIFTDFFGGFWGGFRGGRGEFRGFSRAKRRQERAFFYIFLRKSAQKLEDFWRGCARKLVCLHRRGNHGFH